MCLCRLVHSDGSLVDLSVGGAPHKLLEEETVGAQKEKEEKEEAWIKEDEEQEEDYSCVFDREILSDHLTGTTLRSQPYELDFKPEVMSCLLLFRAGVLEAGGGSSLCVVPAAPPLHATPAAPTMVASGTAYCQDCLLLHHLGVCKGGQSLKPDRPTDRL